MEESGGILSAVAPVTGHTSQSFPNSTTTGDEAFKYESVWGPLFSKPPHSSMCCLLLCFCLCFIVCLGHFCNSDVWLTCNHAMLSSFVMTADFDACVLSSMVMPILYGSSGVIAIPC